MKTKPTREYFHAVIFWKEDAANGIEANTTGIHGIVCIGPEREGDGHIFTHTNMSKSDFFILHSKYNSLNDEDFYVEKP